MKRSRFKIPTWLKTEWPQVCSPPYPDTHVHKLMHSLWLPFFMVASAIWFGCVLFVTLLSLLIDGPIRPSWTLLTSLTHSILQTAMQQYLPQGRHSMAVVRLITSIRIPAFLFPKFSIESCEISIQNSNRLAKIVAENFGVDLNSSDSGARFIEGEWIKFKKCIQSETVILYLHGGAHIFLSSKSHRTLTMGLAQTSTCSVLAIDYRLAPENRFPSAAEDALAAYCFLTNQTIGGILPETYNDFNVILAGDSSGSCLCLQLTFLLKRLNLKMPEGIVLMSPFVDHTITSPSWHFNWNSDVMNLDVRGVVWALSLYSNGLSLSDSLLSPVKMDLKGFPPVLIQVGDAEVLLNDSERLFTSAVHSGISVKLEIYEDMFHVFQAFTYISEANYAMDKMGVFIKNLVAKIPHNAEELVTRIRKKNGVFIEKMDVVSPVNQKKTRQNNYDDWNDFNLEYFL